MSELGLRELTDVRSGSCQHLVHPAHLLFLISFELRHIRSRRWLEGERLVVVVRLIHHAMVVVDDHTDEHSFVVHRDKNVLGLRLNGKGYFLLAVDSVVFVGCIGKQQLIDGTLSQNRHVELCRLDDI